MERRSRGTYRALLRTPGVPRLVATASAVGISGTMAPLAFLLFAREATGSFGAAGAVLAADTVGSVLFAPVRGRWTDRRGPRFALTVLALATAAADGAVIAVGLADGPVPLLAALAFLAGAATPPVQAVLRNVWRVLIGDDAKVQSAFALQVMLGEIAYFSGPLLAAAALALGSPAVALVVAALLSAGGTLAFVRAPAIAKYSAPPPKDGGKGALAHRGVRTVVLTTGLFGATFGILDVAVAGFATSHGARAMAGVALGALSAGVAGGSFLWGRHAQQGPAGTHYVALSALAAVPLGLACLAPTPVALAGLLILVGAGFAPIAAVQLAIMDEVAPPHARTEAGSWAGAAYGALSAAGALLAGQLVDSPGAGTAILAACAATSLATLIALARRATLRPLQPV